MDRNNVIIINILKDAEQGTLSKRKWHNYGCKSESEMQDFLDALIHAGSIIQHHVAPNAAKDGRNRELISWNNDSYFSITEKGREDLRNIRDY